MDKKNVLVTGIGGNVGQGIIRNIRKSSPDMKVTGCNVVEFSAGNHLCDHFYVVPYAYDDNYIDTVLRIVVEQKIDLIIPSTDYEIYYLACNIEKFSCKIAASHFSTCYIYLDKYETFLHHSKHGISFAKSCLPSEYKGQFNEHIVKPKKGRGSRGIHLNPIDLSAFSDDEYMVQDLVRGEEITTAFYITKSNELLGSITMVRKLENGTTTECIVTKKYDSEVEKIINQMKNNASFCGAANLQSIVKESGEIIPFEINCRISGTNSIRSNFGFEDVKYTLEEHLAGNMLSKPIITEGIGVRILMDVIYPNVKNNSECLTNATNYYLF